MEYIVVKILLENINEASGGNKPRKIYDNTKF